MVRAIVALNRVGCVGVRVLVVARFSFTFLFVELSLSKYLITDCDCGIWLESADF